MSGVNVVKYKKYIEDIMNSWGATQAFLDAENAHKQSPHGLSAAIVTEIGELAQALKPDWAWWVRKDKKFEYGDTAGEVADIMHFTLAALNAMPPAKRDFLVENFVTDVLLSPSFDSQDNPLTGVANLVPLGAFPHRDLLEQIASPRYDTAEWGLRIMFSYGDPIDLNKLYYEKAEENLRRWGREDDIPKLRLRREMSAKIISDWVLTKAPHSE